MYRHMCIDTCIYIYIMCIYVYVYMYMHTHILMYVCIYVYTHNNNNSTTGGQCSVAPARLRGFLYCCFEPAEHFYKHIYTRIHISNFI